MERKLELKDIAVYLPYGLKIMDFESEVIYPFLGYEIDTTLTKIILYDEETDWWNLSNFKPILRPISDLYRIITHNGKEIVPIVELANMVINGCEFVVENCKGNNYARFGNNYFTFGRGSFLYFQIIENENIKFDIKNQYKLFDYLHELKIDYRGLIDEGLAIDANTLDNNPYE